MSEQGKPAARSFSNIIIAAALLLPVIGLGGSWAKTHSDSLKGIEWDIPIRGYDPRDLLRGHYIQYQYDWPGLEAIEQADRWAVTNLCVMGSKPEITRVLEVEFDDERPAKCTSFVRADTFGVYGDRSTERGRMYIPQTQDAPLEAKLRDPKLRGIIRARIRDDGVIMPLSIRFVPNLTGEPVQDDGINTTRLRTVDIEEEAADTSPPVQEAAE